MALLIVEYAGLHILHWLISIILPLLLALLAIGYHLTIFLTLRRSYRVIEPLLEQFDELEGCTIENLPAVENHLRNCGSTPLARAFYRMLRDNRELYQGRWLPDPARYLRPDSLLSPLQQNSLSLRPAAGMLALAVLGALTSLLLQNQIEPPYPEMALGLILLPLLIGLAAAILSAANAWRANRMIRRLLQDLQERIASRVPVFSDQAGLALLIDNFLVYDRQMKSTLQEFTATAGRLAESDMADGIRRSVEQVLQESVAPAIQQSAATLGSLAAELTNRQERGMQELAARFATALSAELAAHLQPVNREIAQMGALMADVKNYIEYAMRALETVRKQSEELLADTSQAAQSLADTNAKIAADFTRLDDQLQVLTDSTSQMAGLYQGNEQNLRQSLQQLGHLLDQTSQRLGNLVLESTEAMQTARATAADQQETAGQYLAAMQDQVNELSTQLKTSIQDLLGQVQAETSAIAGHTSSIGQQLGVLNGTLDHSLNEFTQASAQYVRQSLGSLDAGLAELTDRLAHTANEIRDAVDALPAALRQGQGQGTHFGG